MNTIPKFYRIDRSDVYFIKFIFEAYDGIAVVETIDPYEAKIMLHVAPGCEADADFVVSALKNDIRIKPLS